MYDGLFGVGFAVLDVLFWWLFVCWFWICWWFGFYNSVVVVYMEVVCMFIVVLMLVSGVVIVLLMLFTLGGMFVVAYLFAFGVLGFGLVVWYLYACCWCLRACLLFIVVFIICSCLACVLFVCLLRLGLLSVYFNSVAIYLCSAL